MGHTYIHTYIHTFLKTYYSDSGTSKTSKFIKIFDSKIFTVTKLSLWESKKKRAREIQREVRSSVGNGVISEMRLKKSRLRKAFETKSSAIPKKYIQTKK